MAELVWQLTAMNNLTNSVKILALLQVGSLPHDTWVRARANFEEPKCVLVEGLQTHGFA